MIIGTIVRAFIFFLVMLFHADSMTVEIISSVLPEDIEEIPVGFTQTGHVCKSVTATTGVIV